MKFKDAFGYSYFIKRILIFYFGIITQYRFNVINKTKVINGKVLKDLPDNKVLFVSNHQTYFADVACLYNVFGCAKWGIYDHIRFPLFILNPRLNIFFIAAQETMKSGILPKVFARAGSVSIKRSWREAGKEINRGVDPNDIKKIEKAINEGWVITFPQGTTKPYATGRRGTAQIIKTQRPIVVPVVVDGFRRAFDKKGLFIKKRGVELKVRFKEPLQLTYEEIPQEIMSLVMDAIEQSENYQPKLPNVDPQNN